MDLTEAQIKDLIELAQGLCADTPGDSEYVRGQAELICDILGLHHETGRPIVIAAITGK